MTFEIMGMVWQDAFLGVSSLIFSLLLLPIVLNSESKVPRKTSAFWSLGTGTLGVCYLTLGLLFSSVTSFASMILWGVVFVYRPLKKGEEQ